MSSEERFRSIFDLAAIGLAQCDVQTHRFVVANHRMEEITGYPTDELLNLTFSGLIHPEDWEKDQEDWLAIVRGETPTYRTECRYIRKDGRVIWVRIDTTVGDRGSANEPLRTIEAVQDITDQREVTAALHDSEERFRTTFEQVAVGMAHNGLDGRWLRLNRKLCEIVGYSEPELLQMSFQDITYPADLNTDVQQMHKQIAE